MSMKNTMEKIAISWDAVKQWGEEIARRYRKMFCVVFGTGLLAYGFMMTNILNNHDNISGTPGGYGMGISSGRWFLTVLGDLVEKYWGNYTLPLFNGIIAIFFISMASCIIVSILGIRSNILASISGMLFISFPALITAMLFMYTVHYYAVAVLLIVLGVYFGHKEIRGGYYSGRMLLCSFNGDLSGIYADCGFPLSFGSVKERLFRFGTFRQEDFPYGD